MSVILNTDCLDNIIGLSRIECECFEVPANISLSGLYLDEIDGLDLNMVNAAADCADGSVWDMMRKAVEQSITSFKTDYTTAIAKNWRKRRFDFSGYIGRDKIGNNLTISNVAGQRYVMAPVKNGVFRIKRLGLMFAQTGTVDVSIYNNIDDTPLYTFTGVATVANKLNWYTLTEAIELPMYTKQKEYLEYFIVYDNPGFSPKSNTFRCCGTTLTFSCLRPTFRNAQRDARYSYADWCEVTGVNGADIDTIKGANPSFNDAAMGLIVDADIRCNMRGIACNDLDFSNGVIPMVIANAIWYRAGAYLAEKIISTGQLNRYTMLDRERLYGKRNQYAKAYNDRIEWLTNPEIQEVKQHLLNTGCLVCEQSMYSVSLI